MANNADGSIIIDTELDNEGFQSGSEKLLDAVKDITQAVDNMGTNMMDSFSKMAPVLQNIALSAESINAVLTGSAAQAMDVNATMGQAQADIASDALTSQQALNGQSQSMRGLADAAGAVQQGFSSVGQSTTSLDRQMASVQKKIDTLKAKLAEYYKAVDEIKAGTNETLAQTNRDDQVPRILEMEKIELDALAEKYSAQLNLLRQLETEYEKLAALKGVEVEASVPDVDPGNTNSSKLSRFGELMGSVGRKAASFAMSIGRYVKNGLQAFGSKVKESTISSNSLVKSLTSLKRLMITRVKRMFISAIFNNIKQAMQSLAVFDRDFNRSMSNIKNAASGLGANIAVGLGNIISAIEPIITRVISAISTVISYLNALFALLGGKSTITVAKKQMGSYADAANGASGAVEELKRQVYGFDELNKRNKDNTAGGGGGGAASDLFEEVPIESLLPGKVAEIFDKIKAAFEAGDWYGVGSAMAEGLNLATHTVDDWINNTLRPKGVMWANRIAEILNGLVADYDWEFLGKTVADGINSVADIINTFLTKFDWVKLGSGIGKAINGWFLNTDWDLVAKTFSNQLNAFIKTLYGIVTELKWADIGERIGKSFQSWFDNIEWERAANTVVFGFDGVIDTLKNAIQNVNWFEIGSRFSAALTSAIENIDWKNVFITIVEAFKGLLSLILGIVSNLELGQIAHNIFQGIFDGIGEVEWGRIAAAIGSYIISAILGLPRMIIGALSGVFDGLADFFEQKGATILAGCLRTVANDLSDLEKGMSNIVSDISTTVVSAWGDTDSQTTKTWNKIKNNVISNMSSIQSKVSSGTNAVKSTITTAWNNTNTGTINAWNKIKDNIVSNMSNIQSKVSSGTDSIRTIISTAWNKTNTDTVNVWNKIRDSLVSNMSNIQSKVSSGTDSIKSTVMTAWSNIQNDTSSRWSNIQNDVSNKWNTLKSRVSGVTWNDVGENLVNGLMNGIQRKWVDAEVMATNLANTLTARVRAAAQIQSPSRVWAEIGEMLDAGLVAGLKSKTGSVISTATQIVQQVSGAIASEVPQIQLGVSSTISGMQSITGNLSNIALTFRDIVSMISNIGDALRVPKMSTGTIVPAKTKIDDTPEIIQSNYMAEYYNDVDERLAELSYELKQIIEIIKSLGLHVDLDALTKAITKQQRENELSFGGVL